MGTSQVSAVASAVFVAFSLAVAASGATIEQTTNDGSGGSSLQNWDVSGAKLGTPTSGNDYVSEKVLRAPTSGNVTFNGNSLSLGKVGGSADSIFVPYEGDRWIREFTVSDGATASVTLPGETVARTYGPGAHRVER